MRPKTPLQDLFDALYLAFPCTTSRHTLHFDPKLGKFKLSVYVGGSTHLVGTGRFQEFIMDSEAELMSGPDKLMPTIKKLILEGEAFAQTLPDPGMTEDFKPPESHIEHVRASFPGKRINVVYSPNSRSYLYSYLDENTNVVHRVANSVIGGLYEEEKYYLQYEVLPNYSSSSDIPPLPGPEEALNTLPPQVQYNHVKSIFEPEYVDATFCLDSKYWVYSILLATGPLAVAVSSRWPGKELFDLKYLVKLPVQVKESPEILTPEQHIHQVRLQFSYVRDYIQTDVLEDGTRLFYFAPGDGSQRIIAKSVLKEERVDHLLNPEYELVILPKALVNYG